LPGFNAGPGSLHWDARDAFNRDYQFENGYLGAAVGQRNELLILVNRWADARRIFNTLKSRRQISEIGNGRAFFLLEVINDNPSTGDSCAMEYALDCPPGQIDACLIPGTTASHHFCTPIAAQTNYQFVGTVNVSEASQGLLYLQNGTPPIKRFMVAMDQKCGLARASVIKANPNEVIEPTRLFNTKRVGSYTMGYEHTVNGGYGALIAAISVELRPHGGPIIVDVCPVSIYVAY
jgi:hypothetical protein